MNSAASVPYTMRWSHVRLIFIWRSTPMRPDASAVTVSLLAATARMPAVPVIITRKYLNAWVNLWVYVALYCDGRLDGRRRQNGRQRELLSSGSILSLHQPLVRGHIIQAALAETAKNVHLSMLQLNSCVGRSRKGQEPLGRTVS